MSDLIDRQAAIDALIEWYGCEPNDIDAFKEIIYNKPYAQPEQEKETIQKFHDYQIEWLVNHDDIELEPQLEELIIRFLHDTANMYLLEIERREE